MSNIKYKHYIIATIDELRSRKSRPDISRICKYMHKCYKVSPKDTKADLRRCLEERSIFKVEYKGNVSYRNSSNRAGRSKKMSTSDSATATTERRIITSAIAQLIYQDQSYLENGIAFDDLVKAAASQESKYSKKQLEAIVHKELASGSLVRLPNRNLALGPADHDADSSDSCKYEDNADSNTKMTSSANSSCRSSPLLRGRPKKRVEVKSSMTTRGAVRVGERRKMAKKVFDPSDNNAPSKKKRGRPVGSLNKTTIRKRFITNMISSNIEKEDSPDSQHSDGSGEEMEQEETIEKETSGGVCSVCIMQQPRGSNDRLIECRDCSSKAHLSCLQSGPSILKLRPDNTWQCQHCKTCVVCCETSDAGVLTVCSLCLDPYHALCHSPKIPESSKTWDQWKCTNCLESQPVVTGSPAIISQEKDIPPSQDPFLKPHEIERGETQSDESVNEDIPDISDWTCNDVYNYFMKHYPEAAPILREQEFDGQALCVASRSDIVTGLGLPLGPALEVFFIVTKLQTRKDDWTMCWG